jgi:hypothetical protein
MIAKTFYHFPIKAFVIMKRQAMGRFLVIAKGFIPEMGTKPFAIMKGNWECGVPAVCEYLRGVGARALRWPLPGDGSRTPPPCGRGDGWGS